MKLDKQVFARATRAVVFSSIVAMPVLIFAQAGNDSQLREEVRQSLGKHFSGIDVQVSNGVVVLDGQVETLAEKLVAEKKVNKIKNIISLSDKITVAAGERVNDAELQAKLAKALVYDRVGYGTTMFNAITLEVKNGVVTLGGMVVEPVDKDSAINLVSNTKGVQALVDNLKVAPLSDFDNRVRMQEARAVYGAAQLNRYALDPAKPIRIAVENGHVTLLGTVDSEADREVAGVRAKAVPGVFSVVNNLQVAGQTER